jgi:hypothetical protein
MLIRARETFKNYHVEEPAESNTFADENVRGFIEGRAESFYVQALLHMQEFK